MMEQQVRLRFLRSASSAVGKWDTPLTLNCFSFMMGTANSLKPWHITSAVLWRPGVMVYSTSICGCGLMGMQDLGPLRLNSLRNITALVEMRFRLNVRHSSN